MAFALVRADGVDFKNSRKEQFLWLSRLGFETVEFVEVTAETLSGAVHGFAEKIEHYDIPSDGLVLLYDDIAYGQSLGRTAKFPRDSIAFKWPMRSRRRRSPISSGARREQDSSTGCPCLSPWSWKERR